RLQNAVERRLASNLQHALKQLTDAKHAREIAATVAILIDGLWLRHAKSGDTMDTTSAIRHIEGFIDHQLAHERPKEATLSGPAPDFE
ncbi:MAG: TetR family transcriptional regulator C-terminal domain-containing protein, partial [Rhizobiales bacterium]|nr:TetR family transcriptional regulator C-terminal domain-containing protein [Hyphomicrobiales bacterium]